MLILIIRHGQAVDEAPGLGDMGRWLTGRGRKRTRRVAGWLCRRKSRRPVELWTSPLVRSVQTAEILAHEAGLEAEVSVCPELVPGRDPGDLLKLLAVEPSRGTLGLVGHEPQLSLLVAALLGQSSVPPLPKSGVVGVEWDGASPTRLAFWLDPKTMHVERQLDAIRREKQSEAVA